LTSYLLDVLPIGDQVSHRPGFFLFPRNSRGSGGSILGQGISFCGTSLTFGKPLRLFRRNPSLGWVWVPNPKELGFHPQFFELNFSFNATLISKFLGEVFFPKLGT